MKVSLPIIGTEGNEEVSKIMCNIDKIIADPLEKLPLQNNGSTAKLGGETGHGTAKLHKKS